MQAVNIAGQTGCVVSHQEPFGAFSNVMYVIQKVNGQCDDTLGRGNPTHGWNGARKSLLLSDRFMFPHLAALLPYRSGCRNSMKLADKSSDLSAPFDL